MVPRPFLNLIAVVSFLTAAGPAWAQPACVTELLRVVQALLDQPVSPELLERLAPRWRALEEKARALDWSGLRRRIADGTASPAEKSAFEALQKKRTSLSTTIQGTNPMERKARVAQENWERADAQVYEWARKGEPITVEKMLKLNKILGKGLVFNGGRTGILRDLELGLTYEENGARKLMKVLPSQDVPKAMEDFMKWYAANEATMPPVRLAAETYQRLNTIHPFRDANGRTTRLIMDWVLQKHGLPPASFKDLDAAKAIYFPDDVLRQNPAPGKVIDSTTEAVEISVSTLEARP